MILRVTRGARESLRLREVRNPLQLAQVYSGTPAARSVSAWSVAMVLRGNEVRFEEARDRRSEFDIEQFVAAQLAPGGIENEATEIIEQMTNLARPAGGNLTVSELAAKMMAF